MKKKLFSFILALALALPAVVFSAGTYYADGDDILYIGPDNYIYAQGETDAVLAERVSGIVSVVDGAVYYVVNDAASDKNNDYALLYAYGLDQASDPQEIARISSDAVYSPTDGLIYYAPKSDESVLMAYDPSNDGYVSAAQSDSLITEIKLTMEGLRVSTADGEKLYVPSLHALTDADPALPKGEIVPFSGGELNVDAKGDLYAALDVAGERTRIDGGVASAVENGGAVYYIKLSDESSSLYKYDMATGNVENIDDYDGAMINGMASASDYVYFAGKSGVIYQYSVSNRETRAFAYIDVATVKQPYLAAISNLLLIYDQAADADVSFVRKIDLDTYTPDEDDLDGQSDDDGGAENGEFAELSKGSRGDEVVRLQTTLKTLGYLSGSADGIYGNATLEAVMLLQEDMGLERTGVADSDLLMKIFGGEATRYERYAGLKSGDSGSRVTQLQDRLRALYYMVAPASGKYDDYTAEAVTRYQTRMGHGRTGEITDAQMEELYSSKAKKANTYLPLESGDNAPAVKRLAARLKKLGYMSQSATNSYNKYVVRAVKLFESVNGLRQTGKASVKRQEVIYSSRAKPYDPDPTPTPEKKYITEKQLKKMRSWMNKNLGTDYGKAEAIEALQIRLMDLGFMAGSTTRKYDEATYNCVKEAQRAFGLKVNGVANVKTLEAMFMSVG